MCSDMQRAGIKLVALIFFDEYIKDYCLKSF